MPFPARRGATHVSLARNERRRSRIARKRFWYLLLGGAHRVSWLWMWPIYGWCRQLGGRHEIHTPAQIGCGFRVIHCSLACGVSPCAVIGQNLYLTGGNFIGGRRLHMKPGDIQLGDNVELGLCSLLIGPLNVGDRARIGAGATVVKDVPAGATVVGAPVRILCAEVGE